MSETAVEIPGYVAGTWAIDPVHSEVSFVVRHMMVSKVRGRFDGRIRFLGNDSRRLGLIRRHCRLFKLGGALGHAFLNPCSNKYYSIAGVEGSVEAGFFGLIDPLVEAFLEP